MTDAQQAQWEALVPRLEAARQQLDPLMQRFRSLVDPAVRAAGKVSASYGAQLAQSTAGFASVSSAFLDEVNIWFRSIRATYMLWPIREKWRTVVERSTGVAAQVKDANLRADDHWNGPARQAYYQLTFVQSGAAERVGVLAEKVADSLYECGKAMLIFWLALLALITRFLIAIRWVIFSLLRLIAMTAAGLAVAGPVGAAVGFGAGVALLIKSVKDAIPAVRAIWTYGLTALAALGHALTTAMDQADAMLRQTYNLTAFPNGQWPPAPVASLDGRTVGSRWHRPEDDDAVEDVVKEVLNPPPP